MLSLSETDSVKVAGEIPNYEDLQVGFLVGVAVVGILYVILAVLAVSTQSELQTSSHYLFRN